MRYWMPSNLWFISRLARPSVWLSVCPVRARNSKTKKSRKAEIATDVPRGTSKWSASFQMKRSKVKVKVTRRKKPNETDVMFT